MPNNIYILVERDIVLCSIKYFKFHSGYNSDTMYRLF